MHRSLRRLSIALLAATCLAASSAPSSAVLPASAAGNPNVVADLLDEVLDSVVLIATAQNVQSKPGAVPETPKLDPNKPLDEFFKDFFDRQGKNNERGTRPTGEGSGFVIDASGIIVTNNHVIDGADKIEVAFNDGTKLTAEVVGRDKEVDLAVLRVKPTKPLKAVSFGDSGKLRIGEWVLAVGNPFGIGLSATTGIVSGRNRDIRSGRYDNFIQTDASINKGNSGGPLFNLQGEVVGVNTAILSPTGGSVGIGFAVPAATVKPVIDQLLRYGETRRGFIGVSIQDVPPEVATRLGLDAPKGALIAQVVEEGPAAKAGIRVGDVIVSLDGKPVPTSRSLQRLVADAGAGREVDVVVRRDSQDVPLKMTLGRLEDQKLASASPTLPAEGKPLATTEVLGLGLSALDPDSRKRFKIDGTVENGCVVVEVKPSSPLKDANLKAGEVIAEVGQQRVRNPDEFKRRLAALKKEGQASTLALVASSDGKMRFVRIPTE